MKTGQINVQTENIFPIIKKFLYSDHEIFLRELVSNAVDASQKMKVLSANGEFKGTLGDLRVDVMLDVAEKTLTIRDNGIGMTSDEIDKYINQIAFSGAEEFVQKYSGKEGAEQIIGHFGLGFYSAFMVADKVSVHSRSWRADGGELVWTSDGMSGYEIADSPGQQRGAKIVMHLKEDCAEYATESRVKHLIETYSNFVGFPILLNGKRVNEVEALWLKNKSEVSDEQYKAFYQFACKAWDEPSYRLHFSADAPLAINALLFSPSENPERMGFNKTECDVALYSRKVLIDPAPKELLPDWMRFMKGVVDSADIPLNISREILQHNDTAGFKAADEWARQLQGFSASVDIWTPSAKGADLNDVFKLPPEACEQEIGEAFDFAKGGCEDAGA
jgi:molecular chaperone HtpG